MKNSDLTQLTGKPEEVAVDRALAELRSGRPVLLTDGQDVNLVLCAETIEDHMLGPVRDVSEGQARLILAPKRLLALGHNVASSGTIPLDDLDAHKIHDIISQTDERLNGPAPKPATSLDESALDLMRMAMLLPAAITIPVREDSAVRSTGLATVDTESMKHYRAQFINTPRIVSRAPVPLDDIGDSEFVVFRGGEGMRDQVAVVIGNPPTDQPVYVRLHSACLTGDLFASLKCDCGDQLRGSAKYMAENGGGVLLYLDQEGRGNGIANKIRAYRLQHAGYSTYDADEILGFDLDQRGFQFTAAMLRQLGYTSVKLLTNNPIKVAALSEAGLNVVSNHRAKGRFTLHNVAYLAAKRDRAGHFIEDDIECRE
ncbi:MAG: GTP cyclohydrolase II RibA [Hyphomicrobiales bacterium]|nr:GTP cyclohydrolase II RibA [Hyphomicrobiales bacterium]